MPRRDHYRRIELHPLQFDEAHDRPNGYISNFVCYPDDDAVLVVLTNRGFARPGWMAEAVAELLKGGRAR
jgi:hypothetical protein